MARVMSCSFLRLDCSENSHPLFRREYARTNRQRDIKLLRCFPHCCPAHVRRSYCGCSVHVLVTFPTDISAVLLDNLVVCARFEPSRVAPLWPVGLGVTGDESSRENERRLELGQRVSLPTYVLPAAVQGVQRDDNVWIRVDKESDDKQRAFPKNAVLYVINGGRFPKWFYNYDSSVTRAHREMTHHLVVYVFTPSNTQELLLLQQQQHQQQHFTAVVEARHASPGFLLVSYRRSDASSNPGCVLPAVGKATDNVEGGSPERLFVSAEELLSASRIVMGQQQRQPQQFLRVPPNRGHTSQSIRAADAHANDHTDAVHSDIDDDADDTTAPGYIVLNATNRSVADGEDTSLWQHESFARLHYFRDKGQYLLVLWRFLQRVSLADLGLQAGAIDTHVKGYWLHAASALRASQSRPCVELGGVVMSFLINIFGDASNVTVHPMHSTQDRGNPVALPAREETVVQATVYLFVRALSSRSIQQLLHTALSVDRDGATSKRQLQEQFTSLVSDLYDVLGDVLRELSSDPGVAPLRQHPTRRKSPAERPYASLPALVDDVLSLAYGSTHFGELRPEVSALLLNREQEADSLSAALNHAFQVFVVQAKNVTGASIRRRVDLNQLQYRQSSYQGQFQTRTGTLQTAWNRRWLLAPGSMQVVDISSSIPQNTWSDLRLVEFALFVREFGCVDLSIEDDASSMSLRSALSFGVDTEVEGLELVLDGRMHVFQGLPSGMSSKIVTAGGWSVGDYAARFSRDEQTLGVDLYAMMEGAERQKLNALHDADIDDRVVIVRQVSLLLTLDHELRLADPWGGSNPSDLFVFVHGTISGSTYQPSSTPTTGRTSFKNLSAMPNSEKASFWLEQEWTPLLELHAGYVAVSPSALRA